MDIVVFLACIFGALLIFGSLVVLIVVVLNRKGSVTTCDDNTTLPTGENNTPVNSNDKGCVYAIGVLTISLIVFAIVSFLCAFSSDLWEAFWYGFNNTNGNSTESTKENDVEYIRDSGCTLYGNYKSVYLSVDAICNSDYTCKGSLIQQEMYDTFQGWDDFNDTYCVKEVSVSSKDRDYLIENACLLYDNYKTLYLYLDAECNASYSCNGSAAQQERYKTFETWDSFANKYCD